LRLARAQPQLQRLHSQPHRTQRRCRGASARPASCCRLHMALRFRHLRQCCSPLPPPPSVVAQWAHGWWESACAEERCQSYRTPPCLPPALAVSVAKSASCHHLSRNAIHSPPRRRCVSCPALRGLRILHQVQLDLSPHLSLRGGGRGEGKLRSGRGEGRTVVAFRHPPGG
jgi:hypothetical protein